MTPQLEATIVGDALVEPIIALYRLMLERETEYEIELELQFGERSAVMMRYRPDYHNDRVKLARRAYHAAKDAWLAGIESARRQA